MFKGILNGTSTTADQNIVIGKTLNTNSNTRYNKTDNVIEITRPGYYDIGVMLSFESTTTGDVTLNVLANGSPISEMQYTQTVASGDNYTFVAVNTIRVAQDFDNLANISLQLNSSEQIISGLVTIERRK